MGHRGTPTPFVNSFQEPNVGSLRYNTAQYGSPLPIVYGTQRVTVNIIEWFKYLPTGNQGKGGKGGVVKGASGSKKAQHPPTFSVFIAMALCQGPISFTGAQFGEGGQNRIWANAGLAFGPGVIGLGWNTGFDGQTPNSVFESQDPNQPVLGYSGVAVLYGTPLQLGNSPVVPNISQEVTGFGAGTAPGLPDDASPAFIINDLLTNPRYGAGFPSYALDQASLADLANYCAFANFGISKMLNRSESCAHVLEEICQLTVVAMVWSGARLRFIPYATSGGVGSNGSWQPNLDVQYSVGDNDFIEFGGQSDPVVVSRVDPATITNWMTLEYLDRQNQYNNNIMYDWDQAAIDAYGIKPNAVSEGHSIANPTTALASVQFQLQRLQGQRATYKFQLGWTFSLLELMDIVELTDIGAGLNATPVRITSKEENDNLELVFEAEELINVASGPPLHPTESPNPAPTNFLVTPGSAL